VFPRPGGGNGDDLYRATYPGPEPYQEMNERGGDSLKSDLSRSRPQVTGYFKEKQKKALKLKTRYGKINDVNGFSVL